MMDVNKERVGRQFARHYAQYNEAAVVQRDIAESLSQALESAVPELQVQRALEIGIGTGFLSSLLTKRFPTASWYFNDLVEEAFNWLPHECDEKYRLVGDAEQLPYPQELNLIASASAVQWFQNIPQFLQRAKQSLVPGGVLAFSSFGPRHMWQLKGLGSKGLHYPSLVELREMLLVCGFHILSEREWTHTLRFDSGRDVLDHLRRTGVNGNGGNTMWTRSKLESFDTKYREMHGESSTNTLLPLSYHPLLIVAHL